MQIYEFPKDSIEHGKQRNENKHTYNSHKISTDCNGCQHPDRRKTYRFTNNIGDRSDFPSICCSTRNTIMNRIACFGLSIKIKKLPTAHPMKAPKTGINAVNAIKTPIRSAYGICQNTQCNDKHTSKNHGFQTLTCKKVCKCPIRERTNFKVKHLLFVLEEKRKILF